MSARALQRRSATHKEEMQVGYYDEASAATHIYIYIYQLSMNRGVDLATEW